MDSAPHPIRFLFPGRCPVPTSTFFSRGAAPHPRPLFFSRGVAPYPRPLSSPGALPRTPVNFLERKLNKELAFLIWRVKKGKKSTKSGTDK